MIRFLIVKKKKFPKELDIETSWQTHYDLKFEDIILSIDIF